MDTPHPAGGPSPIVVDGSTVPDDPAAPLLDWHTVTGAGKGKGVMDAPHPAGGPSPIVVDGSTVADGPAAPLLNRHTVTGAGKGKEVMDSSHPAGVPSPPVVAGNYGRTILKYLSGQTLNPGNVHDLLKSMDPTRWKEDEEGSKTLADFKKTRSGKMYMDTDELIGNEYPHVDRAFLESLILEELFKASTLRPESPSPFKVITWNAYAILTESRSYEADIKNSQNQIQFGITVSGRLLFRMRKAIASARPNYWIRHLEYIVDQDIHGLTTPEAKAYDIMPQILNEDWDPERKQSRTRSKRILRQKWDSPSSLSLYMSCIPPVQEVLRNIRDETFKACQKSGSRRHHRRGPPGHAFPNTETLPSL
ncbi:hypothetical protein C8R42DRAFT_651421 [Lentinula raphanica]|nr:hypothetical protein C8R42DRAFT_651421 [Lentinula raphanica]